MIIETPEIGNPQTDESSASQQVSAPVVPQVVPPTLANWYAPAVPQVFAPTPNPWQVHHYALSNIAFHAMAVKTDRFGQYSPGGGAYWSTAELTDGVLWNHFLGKRTIGLGVTSPDDYCRLVVVDLDNHVSDESTNQNLAYAIVLRDRLNELGFTCLIENSDGKGGIHLWIVFYSPVPSAIAFRFIRGIVRDYKEHGLEEIETFPKSPSVQHTEAKCGHYLRLPGKHHKRDHWSTFYGTSDWMTLEESVQVFLHLPLNDPTLIPVIEEEAPKRRRVAATSPAKAEKNEALAKDALRCISPDVDYDTWLKIGQALHFEGGHMLPLWIEWSAKSKNFVDDAECRAKWATFSRDTDGVKIGTLFHLAKEAGWSGPSVKIKNQPPLKRAVDLTLDVTGSESNDNPPQPGYSGRSYAEDDRNDIGNAYHFAGTYAGELRYCAAWEKWLVWDGCRWKIDDEERPLKLAMDLVVGMFSETAGRQRSKDAAEHVQQSANISRLRAMIALAGSSLPVRLESLDRNGWLLNCKNGVVDLRTGNLQAHDRDDNITKLCPTDFDPNAEAPRWTQFLEEVFAGDTDLILFVQRLLGYSLTAAVTEQILAIFYGTGANGKSTLLKAFMDTIGSDYTMQCMPDFLMTKKREGHPTEKASLFGKRFVSCAETEESIHLDEATVKMLTGGEKIMARRMREDFWEFDPSHKLVLSTNHKPIIKGTDHGIWRRIMLVPFLQRFVGVRRNKKLDEQLKAERSGILTWAVCGCLDWQRLGLSPPASVASATESYRNSENILERFLADCYVKDRASVVRFSDLFYRLEQWANGEGEILPAKRAVGSWLDTQGYEKYTSNGRCYRGLTLKTTSQIHDLQR